MITSPYSVLSSHNVRKTAISYIKSNSTLFQEKVALLKETEDNGCSPVTSSLALVAPTTTAGATANNVVIVSTSPSTSSTENSLTVAAIKAIQAQTEPRTETVVEVSLDSTSEKSPSSSINVTEGQKESSSLIKVILTENINLSSSSNEPKIEVSTVPPSTTETILAFSVGPSNEDNTGSPPPAKKRALVASSSAVIPSFYAQATPHAALLLPAAQPSTVNGTMISLASQQQQYSAAVQNIQQVATPISATIPGANVVPGTVSASSANAVSSMSYTGSEGKVAGEVLPSLETATTQFITPNLVGHQKDTTWTKLFVGGLPYHTTDKSLRDHFKVYGDIDEAVVITDRQTGKSRGYGFVIMADRPAAERACKEPNPIIDGRKANVNLAILGAKPRGNVAVLNAAAVLAAASNATSAIHRTAATGGSVYPSVATTNPSTTAALFAASQYGLSPTALSQATTAAHPGITANPASTAGYLYQYHAAAAQQAATAALLSQHQYGGSPLLQQQHAHHQAATISSPAFAAALAAQQAASSSQIQYYDTTGTGYHQTGVSVGGSAGINSATNPANSIAGLTSTPNVVGSGSTIVSTGAQYYGQGAQTVAGHHHMSSAAQQAFATLAQLDPYSSYLAAAAAAAASGQNTQNSATTVNPAYAYMPGGAANVGSTGTAHHHHSVNPYAAAAAP